MQKRIAKGTICLVLVVALMLGILSSVASYYTVQEQIDRQINQEMKLISSLMANEQVQDVKTILSQLPSENRITWIDQDGVVIYDNHSTASKMDNHGKREEVEMAISTGKGFSKRYSDTLLQEQRYYATKMQDGTVLRIAATQRSVGGYLSETAWVMLIGVIVSVGLTIIFTKSWTAKIAAPINQLNLEFPLNNVIYDELTPVLRRMEEQRKNIQAKMIEIENRKNELQTIVSHMQEGLLVLDHNKHVLLANVSAGKILNMPTEVDGKTSIAMYYRSSVLNDLIESAIEHGRDRAEMTIEQKRYIVSASMVEGGQALVLLLQDMTERDEVERARKRFTANVSHELRTPLTSICGYAELLASGGVSETDSPIFIGKIKTESERLLKLIEEIIHLSQLDEGAQSSMKKTVDLLEVANNVKQECQSLADSAKVKLHVKGMNCNIEGDDVLIGEIIRNLVENGIKYNNAGGEVWVEIEQKDNQKYLRVRDNGIGIAKENVHKVFERFYRIDKSRSKLTGGTGLGLSIVKHAVEFHNATITLESELGEGTVITIIF